MARRGGPYSGSDAGSVGQAPRPVRRARPGSSHAFFALTSVCLIAFVTVLLSLGDPPETCRFGVGFLQGIRGPGVVFFPLAALVTFFTGWALSGELLRRWWHEIRRRKV